MKTKYLIRLDDACPYMDTKKWQRIEKILDEYGVKPMVGIIPANADPKTMIESENHMFWDKAKAWQEKGWAIALHGYDHVYISNDGLKGLNPLWKRSEFAGVTVEEQRKKIQEGMNIMHEHGFNPKYFFAPSHTFDENTLVALKAESDIRIISDTVATRPYRYKEFVFVPQFSGSCREMKMKGLFAFCLHPNTMNDEAFENTEKCLNKHSYEFTSFNAIDVNNIKKKGIVDRVLSWLYFTQRKIRRIR